jgi:CRISPR/Cas system CSM-associated protein Csm3 (group 7 of RAMP superfamily)
MFKTTHNMMKLKVKITPKTPLLVASGKTMDVTRPDIEFIRINRNRIYSRFFYKRCVTGRNGSLAGRAG